MSSLMSTVLSNEDGATMVEYGILISLIAAVSFAVIKTIGQTVCNAFTSVNTSL